jgi:hypothetical protein
LGRSFTAESGAVGAFDFTEIAQPFRCFRELGEERYPVIVQEADEPRDYGEAAELEQIRSAGPALPVTNTGFARGYTLDVAGMGFVENGRARVAVISAIAFMARLLTRDRARASHGAVKRRGRLRPHR